MPWSGVTDKPTIPTKTSDLTNDSGFAIDSNVVHKSGNETIAGTKTFTSTPFVSGEGSTTGIYIKNTAIARNEVPSTTHYSVLRTLDKNNEILGDYVVMKTDKGDTNAQINIRSEDSSGNQLINALNFSMANDNSSVSFAPSISNKVSLGSSSYKWANAYIDKVVCTRFTHSVNNGSVYITGGSEYDKGATLVLHGDESSDAGSFIINSRDKTRSLYLVGKPDGTLQWAGQNIALDGNVVHTSGNETIAGTKTFSDRSIYNKDLHYKDTKNDWSDTSLNTWCDAGHVAWFDKTGNRRMHELVGANGGVWRKVCYIDENQYFSVDSNRNASFNATVSFNGNIYAYNNIFQKNNNMDITTKPSSTLYSNYIFKDKNEKTLSYIQYSHSSDGTNALGCFLQDNENKLYGVLVNTAKEFYPFGDNTYSLGKSNNKWANVYATTFNGALKGNADSATKASYLDNYSNAGGNKIYLDWGHQVDNYVGLKVDNTTMGGLITTKNIGSQSVSYATTAGSANSVAWANVTGKPNIPTTPNVYVTATWRSGSNWYHKWSNGFIEQGGFTDCALGVEWTDGWRIETNMPLAFSNTNYTLLVTPSGYSWNGAYALPITRSKTTTRFEVYSDEFNQNGGGYDWYACGY